MVCNFHSNYVQYRFQSQKKMKKCMSMLSSHYFTCTLRLIVSVSPSDELKHQGTWASTFHLWLPQTDPQRQKLFHIIDLLFHICFHFLYIYIVCLSALGQVCARKILANVWHRYMKRQTHWWSLELHPCYFTLRRTGLLMICIINWEFASKSGWTLALDLWSGDDYEQIGRRW